MWLGIDDTDSPDGGCTTWVLSEILRETSGYDLIGEPRLVRLNPNVPFKTRGNAALGARWGRGRGPRRRIGEVRGEPLWAYPRGGPLSRTDRTSLLDQALHVVQQEARWSSPATDPALVASPGPLPPSLYWRAMDDIIDPWPVLELLAARPGTEVVCYRSLQGLVGAAAVMAWPARRRTWELITYRPRSRWGSLERRVSVSSVRSMAARHPETFQSYDPETRRLLVSPHTPCPILWGLRGRRPLGLLRARREVRGEGYERWVLFQTNQATGDHLLPRTLAQAAPGRSGRFDVRVAGPPHQLRGGHVVLPVEDDTGRLDCLAFAPTRTLPPVAVQLRPGDALRVWGAIPAEGPTPALHLEGLRVLRALPVFEKLGNPRCTACGHGTRSAGRGKGYRCRSCGARLPPEAVRGKWKSRRYLVKTYHPTASARRHLAPMPNRPWGRRAATRYY